LPFLQRNGPAAFFLWWMTFFMVISPSRGHHPHGPGIIKILLSCILNCRHCRLFTSAVHGYVVENLFFRHTGIQFIW
jgi:hypothetical protein